MESVGAPGDSMAEPIVVDSDSDSEPDRAAGEGGSIDKLDFSDDDPDEPPSSSEVSNFQPDPEIARKMAIALEDATARSFRTNNDDSDDEDMLTSADFDPPYRLVKETLDALISSIRDVVINEPLSAYLFFAGQARLRDATRAALKRVRAILNARSGVVLRGNTNRSRPGFLIDAEKELEVISRCLFVKTTLPSDGYTIIQLAESHYDILRQIVGEYEGSKDYPDTLPRWYEDYRRRRINFETLSTQELAAMREFDADRPFRLAQRRAQAVRDNVALAHLRLLIAKLKQQAPGSSVAPSGNDKPLFDEVVEQAQDALSAQDVEEAQIEPDELYLILRDALSKVQDYVRLARATAAQRVQLAELQEKLCAKMNACLS